jgi:hypothetical protein
LANRINAQMAQPSAVFFAVVDQARETFRDAILRTTDALTYADRTDGGGRWRHAAGL